MSLRQQKKAMTRDAILDSAEDLFATQGYVATTIEQIADRAMVAVGTVYNYFASKTQLLVAVNERDTRELLEKGESVVKDPPADPQEACAELLWLYVGTFLRKYDRELLREMWRAAVAETPDVTREFLSLDELLIQQLAQLLDAYQQRDTISSSLPVEQAAWMLYGVMSSTMGAYLMSEDVEPATVEGQIHQLAGLAFRDWRRDD